MRATVVAVAVLLCLSFLAARHTATASGEARSLMPVELVGRGEGGNTVRIVWGADGGDVTTDYGGGVRRRTWFRGDRGFRQEPSGDVYALPRADAELAQAERFVLTGEFRDRAPMKREESSGIRLEIYKGPGGMPVALRSAIGGSISMASIGGETIAGLSYDGRYAVRWNSTTGFRFERSEGPRPLAAFAPAPRSYWERESSVERVVDAEVGGRRASVFVDTGMRGLAVSRAFAVRMRAVPIAAGAANGTSAFVRLPEIILAGKRVAPAIASVVADSRYDVFAGIGLFPRTSLAFDRTGVARTTPRRCRDGYPISEQHGVVLMQGPDGTTSVSTLLDTGHRGPPSVDLAYALSPAFGERNGACTASARTLAFGGRRFGAAVLCRNGFAITNGDLGFGPNLVLGLDSLDARELLVDLRDDTVCWFT